jgi:glycosyltransferase involved in cell wall biosynthesis
MQHALPTEAPFVEPADPTPGTIVVDVTPILPGGTNGGAKVFVLELIRCLAELAPETQFVLLTQADAHEELSSLDGPNVRRLMVVQSRHLTSRPPFRRAVAEVLRRIPQRASRVLRRLRYRAGVATRRNQSAALLNELGADLLFCPFTAPTYFDRAIPTVSVVYDLQFAVYPQFFPSAEVVHREQVFADCCRHSTMIATISDYTRNASIDYGRIAPAKVKTIELGVPRHLLRAGERDDGIIARASLRAHRYLIYPANFWQHKNHEMLFTAFGLARHMGLPPDIKLVCTGAPGARQDWLKSVVQAMGLQEFVVFPGYVSSAELLSLITNCTGVIFPSLYEGFGLPVIEAMAAGVPVACSNTTSLPEVAGDAAILFDPRAPQQIAEGIIALSCDKTLTTRLVEKGNERVVRYSDSRIMARKYLKLFNYAVAARADRSQ